MSQTTFEELLDAGVHYGHLRRKWNPKMAPYIFMEKNGIHIIDLHKTLAKIEEAANVLKQMARSDRQILFVATKRQAKDVVAERVKATGMPYVTERWAGGMLTNFMTLRKSVRKMSSIDAMATDSAFDNLSKREKLQIARERAKLEKNFGSIVDLTHLPAALFVVDIQKEANAVREAQRLNIPVIAIVDTCCNPTPIKYIIPANDDATKSIALIIDIMCKAIEEGTKERRFEKDKAPEYQQRAENSGEKQRSTRLRARKSKAAADKTDAVATESAGETES